jgi:putative membrane protein
LTTTAVTLSGTRRPERALLLYYVLTALATGPGLIFLLPYGWFRYHTLRYTFDDEGISVRWGLLFRREVTLTYARIQDIHLLTNVVERWLGLGRVQIQTASGQSAAEITIEGLKDYETVRDELYSRMRGSRRTDGRARAHAAAISAPGELADVAAALREAAAELRALRTALHEDRT